MGLAEILARNRADRAAGVARTYTIGAPPLRPPVLTATARRPRLPLALLPCTNGGTEVVEMCPTCGGGNRHVRACAVRWGERDAALRDGVCTWEETHGDVMSCRECQVERLAFEPVATFAPVTTRHLLYHVYPVRGNGFWEWNVDELMKRIGLFNGRKVVAVALDPESGRRPDPSGPHAPDGYREIRGCDTLEAVRARFGPHAPSIEFVAVENDPQLREVASFEALFARGAGATGPGDVTLYAQAKGTTRPRGHVARRWTEALLEVLVDHFPVVEQSLAHHPITGAFRKYGPGWPTSQSASDWHYSGSWFWFRNSALFAKPDWRRIDKFWSGIEPYPSQHFGAEAGCVFHEDRVSAMNLYSAPYWASTVAPALAQFRADNAGRRTPTAPEADWFPHDAAGWLSLEEGAVLRELAVGKRVLEIGSFAGRSTVCLAGTAGSVECIDTFDARGLPQPRDTYPEFRANLERYRLSQKVTARRGTTAEVSPLLPAKRYDLVFVDADHSAPFLRIDLAAAKRLLAPGGVLALHDYHHPEYPDVAKLVEEWELVVENVVGVLAVCRFPSALPRLSVIVPTSNRPEQLVRALASAAPQLLPGDEILSVADASGDWGATPRTSAMHRAAGDYLVFLDDDDVMTPDALVAVRAAVAENPNRPHLFRMRRGPQGDTLPGPREVGEGNVSSQMFVCPNDPARLGTWGTRYEGDFDFIRSTLAHYPDGPVWRDEVIAVWRPGGEAQ